MLCSVGEPCAVISNFNQTLYKPILASAQPRTGQAGAESAGLYTSGGLIYGSDGSTVTLRGLNWFGFDDGGSGCPLQGSATLASCTMLSHTGGSPAVTCMPCSTGNTLVDGLWAGSDSSTLDVATILLRMKALGFNAIRLPFSFKVR